MAYDDWKCGGDDDLPSVPAPCEHRWIHRGECVYCGVQVFPDSGLKDDKADEEAQFERRQWQQVVNRY